MVDLKVDGFTGPWSLIVKDIKTNQDFYLLKSSTESGHIIIPMSYFLNKLNPGIFHLLGKHEIQFGIISDEDGKEVIVNTVRIFNEGLQPLEEKDWKTSFTNSKNYSLAVTPQFTWKN